MTDGDFALAGEHEQCEQNLRLKKMLSAPMLSSLPRYHGFMPIHDRTRVSAGTFYAFHIAWIAELQRALNGGLLPPGYYALAEQVASDVVPDVLTLQGRDSSASGDEEIGRHPGGSSGVALAEAPPKVMLRESLGEAALLATKRRRLVIRHATGDRIVALLEIVSPGNKESRAGLEGFVDKAVAALGAAYHLLLLDLFPPGRFDAAGIHGALWQELGGAYKAPPGKPLTLSAYTAAEIVTCYVEATCVGAALVPMPLFLDPGHYINVPLEPTYLAAYEGLPTRWKRVIEGGG